MAILFYSAPPGVPGIDSYTKLMLHGDEDPLVDSSLSPHTLTPVNAARSATQSKFGGYAIYFDGSGDYINVPNHDDWNVGSGNFSVDAWVYFEAFPNSFQFITSQWQNSSKGHQFFYERDLDLLHFSIGNGGTGSDPNSVSWNPTTGVWYHVAVDRNGDNLKFYINGTQQGSTQDVTGVTMGNSSATFQVGCYTAVSIDPNSYFNGWIDELRWSKGISRFPNDFTPPEAPYI